MGGGEMSWRTEPADTGPKLEARSPTPKDA